jgi:hypothetical protein
MDLTNFLFKMSAAKDTEELWNLLLAGMDFYGFDRLLYGFHGLQLAQVLGIQMISLFLAIIKKII